jgi:hypothetical protein
MDLSELTNATLLVRYACDGIKPASNTATLTVPSRNAAPTADIDRVAELLTVSGTAPEYRTENGWTAVPAAGLDVSSFYGAELAVREKYDADHFASLPVVLLGHCGSLQWSQLQHERLHGEMDRPRLIHNTHLPRKD